MHVHSDFVFTPTLSRAINNAKTDRIEKFELIVVKSSFDALTDPESFPRELTPMRALVPYILERCPSLKEITVGYAKLDSESYKITAL